MHQNPIGRRPRVVAGLLTLLVAMPARGITINLTYDYGGSQPPGQDPTGVGLRTVMRAAADYWEEIFRHSWTVDITYYYDTLPWGSYARSDFDDYHSSFNRIESGEIAFDDLANGQGWFIDPTPYDHAEFDLRQTLYRDIAPSHHAGGWDAWFNGSVPDVLEVGYGGAAVATAPADARIRKDLLSTAVHEIGHFLGFHSYYQNLVNAQDGDYDVPAFFTGGGAAMSIRTYGDPPFVGASDVNDWTHLAPTMAGMYAIGNSGERRLPCAADIAGATGASNWLAVDLPRDEYLGGSDFSDATNWMGGRRPDGSDDVWVRQNTGLVTATAHQDMIFHNLNILERSWVSTGAHRLTIFGGTTTIDGAGGPQYDTRIRVNTDGILDSGLYLELMHGAYLEMSGGRVYIGFVADVDGTSRIGGYGTINAGASARVHNDGDIRASGGSTPLILTTTGNHVWDLDGRNEQGVVEALGNMEVIGSMAGPFNGIMRVHAGRTIDFSHDWTLGLGLYRGHVDLLGGTTNDEAAAISGGDLEVQGQITVSGHGRLEGAVAFSSSAGVSALENAVLTLAGPTTMQGGSFTGEGTMQQNGDLHVTGNTNIDVAVYDWDGTTVSSTTIDPGIALTINADAVETGMLLAAYDGVVHLNGGRLNVNTTDDWRLGGTLYLTRTSGVSPRVDGSRMVVGGVFISDLGIIRVGGGTSQIDAPVRFLSNARVEIDPSSTLVLNNTTNYFGGTYTGNRLYQHGDAIFERDTTIDVSVYDWDGPGDSKTTVLSDVTVTLSVDHIDTNLPAFDGFDGTLVLKPSSTVFVNTPGRFRLDGELSIDEAILSVGGDGTIENRGLIRGSGMLGWRVENRGEIRPAMDAQPLSIGAIFPIGFYTQHPEGKLTIDITGPAADAAYGQLTCSGDVKLDGALEVILKESYEPSWGEEYVAIEGRPVSPFTGTITGRFDDLSLPVLTDGLFVGVYYDAHHLDLWVQLRGDMDGNGVFDAFDVDDFELALADASAYFAIHPELDLDQLGDFDGDGMLDTFDVDGFEQALAASGALSNVPEPATLALLGLGGLMLALKRR